MHLVEKKVQGRSWPKGMAADARQFRTAMRRPKRRSSTIIKRTVIKR
ncbi:MAG: hypothetical protein JSR91_05735 [Proteobacteria bacterium]|nr:hypothetical protein [Pseudomonadota bacterium]